MSKGILPDKSMLNHSIVHNNNTGSKSIGGLFEFTTSAQTIFQPCLFQKHIMYDHNVPATVICVSFIIFGVVYSLFGK